MAQSPPNLPVYQTGLITPGHVPVFNTAGVVADAGFASSGSINSLGLTATGLPFCINDAGISNPSGYHQFCIGANVNGGGALLSYLPHGGASPLPLLCNVNGVTGTCFGNVIGAPVVVSVTALRAESTATNSFVIRSDWSPGFGAPSMTFIAGVGTCTSIGKIDDGASCVNSADGNHWNGQFTNDIYSVQEFGAVGDGVTDDTTAINNALAALSITGGVLYLPQGQWHITDALTCASAGTFPTPKIVIEGAGPTVSIITIGNATGNDFNMSAVAVIVAGSSGTQPGCDVKNLAVSYYQTPSPANLAAIVEYPVAILANNTHWQNFQNIAVTNAWQCLTIGGSSTPPGGVEIGNIACSSYNQGLGISNATAAVHIGKWDEETYGLTSAQATVFEAAGEAGSALTANLQKCNGCKIDTLIAFSQGVNIGTTTSTPWTIGYLALDNDGAVLTNSGNQVTISGGYSTKSSADTIGSFVNNNSKAVTIVSNFIFNGTPTAADVNSTAGEFQCSNCQMYPGSGTTYVANGGLVQFTGGYISIAGNGRFEATSGQMLITGARISVPSAPTASNFVSNGGTLVMKSNDFTVPNVARTQPVVEMSSGALKYVGNTTNGASAGALGTPFLAIDSDQSSNYIARNQLNKWGVTANFVTSSGYYDIDDYKFPITATTKFATLGDYSEGTQTTIGWYRRLGDMAELSLSKTFNPTYTTASGIFSISTNAPVANSSDVAPYPCTLGEMAKATYTTGQIPFVAMSGGGSLQPLLNASTVGVTNFSTTNVPSGTTNMIFQISCSYRVR